MVSVSLKDSWKWGRGGGYGSALVKNRHYLPRGVHGDGINEYFRSKNIGDVECLSG